jgi:hypothetical protein
VVCLSVIVKPRQRGGPGPLGAVAPWETNTYSECVPIALVIQHAMHMRHIVICGLPVSTIFSHIISQTAGLSAKKLLNTKCVF